MDFFNAFILTLFHSLWQSVVMLLLFYGVSVIFSKIHPLQKRNFLYSILGIQILMSLVTFVVLKNQLQFNVVFILTNQNNWIKNYSNIIITIYFIVIFYKFVAVIFQWNRFKNNYTKSLISINNELKLFTLKQINLLGIRQQVDVWYSTNITVPITFNFIKPIILLPLSLSSHFAIKDIEAIILHELVHIKNKDFLLNWVLVMVEILFFFNPFIKIIVEKLKIEREKNCDVFVLQSNYDHLHYAEVLLNIARINNAVKVFQIGAVKHTSQLLKRILFFSEKQNLNFRKYNFAFPLLISFGLLVFATIKMSGSKIKIAQSYHTPKPLAVTNNKKFNYPTIKQNSTIINENQKKINKPFQKANIKNPIVEKNIALINVEKNIPENQFGKNAIFLNEADSVKDFIYDQETQQGKMTQYYKLIKHNGKWTAIPQWMVIVPYNDSLKNHLKDSIYMLQDSIQ